MATTMRLPRRWFAPRENIAPAAPFRDDMDKIFQAMFNGMAAPWEAMNEMLPFWRHQKAENALLPDMDLMFRCGRSLHGRYRNSCIT